MIKIIARSAEKAKGFFGLLGDLAFSNVVGSGAIGCQINSVTFRRPSSMSWEHRIDNVLLRF